MKTKRLIPIAAAFSCVLFILAFRFIFTADVEHPHEQGERLSIAGLRADEEIIVSTLFEHRTAHGREYRIRRLGQQLTVAVFDTTPAWSRDDRKDGAVLLFMRPLSDVEVDGLSETVAYCRETREEISSAIKHISLRYLRSGKEIGREFYIGFALPSQLAWFDRQGMRGNPDFAQDYERLAAEFGVSPERLRRMIPFEMLEKEKADYTLQPTADLWVN